MRVLLDTNVILDHFVAREPYRKQANAIFDLIARNKVVGYVITSSVTDIYYILRKTFNDTESREKINTLLYLLQAVEVTKADCLAALNSPMPDFEDALAAVCAEREGLDFIVTRDNEFLSHQKAISPGEFLPPWEAWP